MVRPIRSKPIHAIVKEEKQGARDPETVKLGLVRELISKIVPSSKSDL